MASWNLTNSEQESTMANSIELERRMAETNIEEALNHLKNVEEMSEFGALRLHLRFLFTFVNYTAKGCFDYESLPNVLTLINNVGLLVQKLPLRSFKDQEVAKVLEELKHLQPEVEHVYFLVSQNTPAYRMFIWGRYYPCLSQIDVEIRDLAFLKFVSFVREDMRLLLQKRHNLVDGLRNQIDILHGNLIYIDGLLEVTSNVCPGFERRYELFTHFQFIADKAAFLSYCCLADKMTEHQVSVLALQYSQLNMKIEPSTQEVRELYIQVLKALKSWRHGNRKLNLYPRIYFAESYVKVLVHLTKEVLKSNRGWVTDMKDGLKLLHLELRSLAYMVANRKEFILQDCEVNILIDLGCLFLSNYNKEMNKEAINELSILLESMSFNMLQVKSTHDLDRSVFLNNHIQMIQRDVAALRTILSETFGNKHQDKQFEQICSQVMEVSHEAEDAIDCVLLSIGTFSHHMLLIFDVVDKITRIKAEINTRIQCSDNTDGEKDSDEIDQQKERHDIANDSVDEEKEANPIKEDRHIIGFDEEATLIQFLLAESEGTETVFITGMPGVGKSTLANTVFDDLSIKKHFDVYARCVVSQVYDKRTILIKLIKTANVSRMEDGDISTKSYNDLELLFNQRLKKRKYLIFLDDIWESRAWNDLKRSFPPQSAGSKILLTTRSEDLPFEVNDNSKVIPLQPLSAKKSLELLNLKLFGDGSCPSHLKDLLNEIARRCKGLPLAIQLVAGILRGQNKRDLWSEVAKSPNSYILDDCKGILDLSYNKLPYNLKCCFLYLGAFPEDEVIASKKLRWLWIAEGFVEKTNEKSLELIAEDCLKDLISRNLITCTKRRSLGGTKNVIIHDLVRNYCLDKSEDEKFLPLLDIFCNNPSFKNNISKHRRLAMHLQPDIGKSGNEKFYTQVNVDWFRSTYPLARTLLFFPHRRGEIQPKDISSICRGYKTLRILDLMGIDIDGDVLSAVYTLAHLRYLAICGIFDHLSESISELSNLETLIVKTRYDKVVRLPLSFLSMIKLRHLHIKGSFVLHKEISFSKLLEKLENLETISAARLPFKCFTKERMKFPKAKMLKCIVNCILLPSFEILTELESLKISTLGSYRVRLGLDFSFPKRIKKLSLSDLRLPWENISMIGELKNLEVLKLLYRSFQGGKWELKDEMFPKVKFLQLKDLNIESWIRSDDCEDDSYFPSLEQLELRSCMNLQDIPSGLGCFGYLKIIKVQDCRPILLQSIRELEEEQNNLCNEDLKVEFKNIY